ncbi:membrane-associated phospholipid phosphatase [Clostridium tetanomorphum]|uniref:Inositol phosphorylceramide synthase n=1 Tax=Clostridium tetanomorphum TaxID=1553 RepID=A0A923EAD9_CLOTT|nr:phosphatase PAP2 family protein [Clostridium tetanomorphum]KAJ53835.1 Ser/Thr and Tyr protein phosphatase [Clostridium tetanomorphum DSM 665]MBC2397349.1 inositol phosphorylceramide synthase [Clostridium tetanomorphum]MBP1862569.1 membrane-associated phospholipid phosphatase [Clostridium tetanomorphum]NRS85590.1 membrane-associated phospholipid phosphatase [Clostridium tetanomorphum]NRZ96399.1 membrane-associated phospholipid phosphatase [Clostridium tetanomorphum]
MERIKNNSIHLLALLSIPIINIFYGLLNNSERGSFSLVTEIDKNIPFMKEFIIPYIMWYPYIFIIFLYLCLKNLNTYYRTLISLNIGLIICYITYFLFQTTVPRPHLYGNDIFIQLTKLIYRFDKPFNCFPSIHVLTCYLMIKGINFQSNCNKFTKLFVYITSITIIISTLFVKQHVIMDLISAIALAELIFHIVGKFNWKFLFIPDTE